MVTNPSRDSRMDEITTKREMQRKDGAITERKVQKNAKRKIFGIKGK